MRTLVRNTIASRKRKGPFSLLGRRTVSPREETICIPIAGEKKRELEEKESQPVTVLARERKGKRLDKKLYEMRLGGKLPFP